jgi:ATP-dependent DNA ligase
VTYRDKVENNIIQYSRTGAHFFPKDYLNEELKMLLSEDLNPQPYLDGELYLHGYPLNVISGQVRKENYDVKLEYYIFDIFFIDNVNIESKYRQDYLTKLFQNKTFTYLKRVENFTVNNITELKKLAKAFVKDGYEGAVIRKDNMPYKYSYNNYHSSNVIKLKPVYSDEFRVIGFTEGKKGKDLGKIIWICEIDNPKKANDAQFNVVPNMTLEEREKLFNYLLTVEYTDVSDKTGKPLQAKAITFRTYENNIDIIQKIFKECGI